MMFLESHFILDCQPQIQMQVKNRSCTTILNYQKATLCLCKSYSGYTLLCVCCLFDKIAKLDKAGTNRQTNVNQNVILQVFLLYLKTKKMLVGSNKTHIRDLNCCIIDIFHSGVS